MNIGKVHISKDFMLERGLCKLYGINRYTSRQITSHLGFAPNVYVRDLTHIEVESLLRILDKFYVFDLKLRFKNKQIFDEQLRIRSYRGMRRKAGLPCRGQRTKTNASTARKNKQK
jgi:small subunit ribosomal protein S13